MAYSSNFPNEIDSFTFKTEILASDVPAIQRFQELKLKQNRTPAEEQELGHLTNQLRSKLMSADEWNKFADALVNMEVFIRDEVVVTIDQRRDAALQAIDQKTNNVIQYLDGTTAGQLRNDIGIMGNLTTTAKDSLVNAINEVNSEVKNIRIPDASLTEKGIVKLNNAINSTSDTDASTPSAVKQAYDRANTAETNAKGYADTNFYKREQFKTANLVKNSSGFFGLQNWTSKGTGTWRTWDNSRYGSFISFDQAAAQGDWQVLDSDPIGVGANGKYTLSIDFHTSGITAADAVFAEIKAPAGSQTNAAVLRADANKWWHTKSITFTVPSGVTAIEVRLVVHNKPTGVSAGFSRITLTETTSVQPYSLEGDIKALFQSVANGKNDIAAAIRDKGQNAQGSDSFQQLASAIRQIGMGGRILLSPLSKTLGTSIDDWTFLDIVTIPSSQNFVDVFPTGSNMEPNITVMSVHEQGYQKWAAIVLIDEAGVSYFLKTETALSTYPVVGINALNIDRKQRKAIMYITSNGQLVGETMVAFPSNFNFYGRIRLCGAAKHVGNFGSPHMSITTKQLIIVTT